LSGHGKASTREVQKLQKGNQQLLEENNMLKVKNDILLDMMAEVYAEYKLEVDKHKKN
jgi:regulator of replication initiation timing